MIQFNIQNTMRKVFQEHNQVRAKRFVSNETQKKTRKPTKRKPIYDRLVTKVDRDRYSISSSSEKQRSESKRKTYEGHLEESLLSKESIKAYALQRTKRKPKEQEKFNARKRNINSRVYPFRVFAVEEWKDNFYTTLLDWSYNNFICAGSSYSRDICFYNMAHEDEFENALYRKYRVNNRGQNLSAVKFSQFETKVALGYLNGTVKIYDYLKEKTIFSKELHKDRVANIEWDGNNIFTASKDREVKCINSRTLSITIDIPSYHSQQVCGIKAGRNLLASGGNDNMTIIYDLRKEGYLSYYHHEAAIKALTWVDKTSTFISGGGTVDRKMKFWKDGEQVYKEIDTGAQVCHLLSSKNTDEIVSCQGYSLNQIVIWNYEGERVATIHGHSSRVLYGALSPSGQLMATGAGDRTLKIWRMFPSNQNTQKLFHKELR